MTSKAMVCAPTRPGAPRVTLWTSAGCPNCAAAARYLCERGIPFVEQEVHQNSAGWQVVSAKLRERGLKTGAVPVFQVGEQYSVGHDPAGVDRFLASVTPAAMPPAATGEIIEAHACAVVPTWNEAHGPAGDLLVPFVELRDEDPQSRAQSRARLEAMQHAFDQRIRLAGGLVGALVVGSVVGYLLGSRRPAPAPYPAYPT